jgi:hypothetical protein
MTPADLSSLNTVLVVIAVAVSVQTVMLAWALVAGLVAWRRLQARLDERYAALAAQLEDALAHTRAAAQALHRASDEVADSLGAVRHGLQSVATFVSTPRNLLVAGATSAVSALMARWRRRR